MKLTLESTAEIVTMAGGKTGRIWRGQTESGVPVLAVIGAVMPTIPYHDIRHAEFIAELEEITAPVVIDLRNVI